MLNNQSCVAIVHIETYDDDTTKLLVGHAARKSQHLGRGA